MPTQMSRLEACRRATSDSFSGTRHDFLGIAAWVGFVGGTAIATWALCYRFYPEIFAMRSDGCLGEPGRLYDCTGWNFQSAFLDKAIPFCNNYMANATDSTALCWKDCVRLKDCAQLFIPKWAFIGLIELIIGMMGLCCFWTGLSTLKDTFVSCCQTYRRYHPALLTPTSETAALLTHANLNENLNHANADTNGAMAPRLT